VKVSRGRQNNPIAVIPPVLGEDPSFPSICGKRWMDSGRCSGNDEMRAQGPYQQILNFIRECVKDKV
jgi:hypothetical protein